MTLSQDWKTLIDAYLTIQYTKNTLKELALSSISCYSVLEEIKEINTTKAIHSIGIKDSNKFYAMFIS